MAADRIERPRPAAEWSEGSVLYRAFVSAAHAAPPSAFTEWFGIESAPAPEGYVLRSATFQLVGGRSCAGSDASPRGAGTSSECRQDSRGEGVVRWAFRFEGHDTTRDGASWTVAVASGRVVASGPVDASRGVLVCAYEPAGTLAAPKK